MPRYNTEFPGIQSISIPNGHSWEKAKDSNWHCTVCGFKLMYQTQEPQNMPVYSCEEWLIMTVHNS